MNRRSSGTTRLSTLDADEMAAWWSDHLQDHPRDATARADFETWLGQDASRLAAFERAESARRAAERLTGAPELLSMRNETWARIAEAKAPWSLHKKAIAGLAVVALFVAVPYFGWVQTQPATVNADTDLVADEQQIYETAVGERLVATLDDGSQITVNTDSRVSVEYTPEARNIRLKHGQAFFEVAKNPDRPFVVTAGAERITALGTAFDVRLSARRMQVTLLEGAVAVESVRNAPGAEVNARGDRWKRVDLKPGQQLIAVEEAPPLVREAEVERVASWRNGQLIFEDETLADAVAEMNRYSQRQIVIGDQRLAGLRISGAFGTGQSKTFVQALAQYFPIRVDEQQDGRIALVRREAGE